MMGLEIVAKPGPIPREIMLKLTCDGLHDPLLPISYTFEAGGDFQEMRKAATALGWKETYVTKITRKDGDDKASLARIFLCPECAK